MEEVRQVISVEQTTYVLTKEELEKLKKDERIKGRNDILDYLQFSIKNYRYEMNIYGMKQLIVDIIDFITKTKNIVDNTYRYSFSDYIKRFK